MACCRVSNRTLQPRQFSEDLNLQSPSSPLLVSAALKSNPVLTINLSIQDRSYQSTQLVSVEESAESKLPPQDTSTRAYDKQPKQVIRSPEEAGGTDADPGDPVLVPYHAGNFFVSSPPKRSMLM